MNIFLYITCSQNNTHICIRNYSQTIFKISAGCIEKNKAKRSNALVAQKLIEISFEYLFKIQNITHNDITIFLKGFGKGRSGVLKSLNNKELNVSIIYHINTLPFNGCKSKKNKRL